MDKGAGIRERPAAARPARWLSRQVGGLVARLSVPEGIREHIGLMGSGAMVISGVAGVAGVYGVYAVITSEKHPDPWFWLFVAFAVLFVAQIRTVHAALSQRRASGSREEITGSPQAIAELVRELSREGPKRSEHLGLKGGKAPLDSS